MGLHAILSCLDCVHTSIKLVQSHNLFMYDFIDIMKLHLWLKRKGKLESQNFLFIVGTVVLIDCHTNLFLKLNYTTYPNPKAYVN